MTQRRPNILVFMTDDHGQWASGAYGNTEHGHARIEAFDPVEEGRREQLAQYYAAVDVIDWQLDAHMEAHFARFGDPEREGINLEALTWHNAFSPWVVMPGENDHRQ